MPRQANGCKPPPWPVLSFFLLETGQGMANPADYPGRSISNYAVDVSLLILWWEEPRGMRPLKGWKHIRGILGGETTYFGRPVFNFEYSS